MDVDMDRCVLMGIVRGNRGKAFLPQCDRKTLIR